MTWVLPKTEMLRVVPASLELLAEEVFPVSHPGQRQGRCGENRGLSPPLRGVLRKCLHFLTSGRPPPVSSGRPCAVFAVKQQRPVPAAKPRHGTGPGSCGARPSCCVSEALGSLHVVGDRALSCLLTARELAHFKRGPAARPRVGLWLCAGHFPCPLPSFFFCQLGREHFLFPPAGEMVPCRGFLVWVCPSQPSGQDCASREQACFSLTPAWLFRLSVCFSLIELLGPGDLLRSYMKSHLILSPSFNGNLVW